jgi:hypothetical protein
VSFRANYTTVYVGAQLAPEEHSLDLDWATDAGDGTEAFEFEVSTAEPHDPLIGLQAFDVGEFGHEILVNDESLSGFDIPPNEGWQYWVDTVTGASLQEGTNTVRITRDVETDDAFAVGTLTVHWRAPPE